MVSRIRGESDSKRREGRREGIKNQVRKHSKTGTMRATYRIPASNVASVEPAVIVNDRRSFGAIIQVSLKDKRTLDTNLSLIVTSPIFHFRNIDQFEERASQRRSHVTRFWISRKCECARTHTLSLTVSFANLPIGGVTHGNEIKWLANVRWSHQ